MNVMAQIGAQPHNAATNVPAEELRSAQDAIERLGADFHQAIAPTEPGDAQSVLIELRQASQDLSDALSQAQQVVNAIAAFTNHLGLAPIRQALPKSAPIRIPTPASDRQVPPEQPAASAPSSEPQPRFTLAASDVQRLKAALPVFAGPGSKTRGTFVTPDGKEIPMDSGEDPITKAIAAGLGLRRVAPA